MAVKKALSTAERKKARKLAHVSLYLRPIVRARIDELAEITGMTKSAVISSAVDAFYLSRSQKERDAKTRAPNGSKAVSSPGKGHLVRYLR